MVVYFCVRMVMCGKLILIGGASRFINLFCQRLVGCFAQLLLFKSLFEDIMAETN